MRVLGISGSPKKKGFTSILLDEALDGARAAGANTEKIILNDLSIRPCQECLSCEDNGLCAVSDDMKTVHDKIGSADALVVASPIYFGTITAQLKTMIDRCNNLWAADGKPENGAPRKRTRRGAFICIAGEDKKEYFKNASAVIRILFATLDVTYESELFVGGINHIGENSPKRKEALIKSYELGLSIAKPS